MPSIITGKKGKLASVFSKMREKVNSFIGKQPTTKEHIKKEETIIIHLPKRKKAKKIRPARRATGMSKFPVRWQKKVNPDRNIAEYLD